MSKIYFNEDPNHFIYTRVSVGIEKITKKDLTDFIDQYKGTGITDFLICINASLPWYPSKKTQNALDKYKNWVAAGKTGADETNMVVKCTKLLVDIYEREGLPMHAIWINRLREDGIHPWITIRMNDIHNAGDKGAFLHSDFFDAHPEYNRVSHRMPAGYFEFALDYMFEDVRNYYKTVVTEALDTFDVDGIELDWMREIYSIGIGREYEGVEVINKFMTEIFSIVKNAELKYQHKIKIGVRLPDTAEKCLRLGFDFFNWVDNGLVDLITVTPRWSSVDNDMPIDLWKKILRGKNVEVAAGLEILIDAYNRRGRKYCPNTYETAIGSACEYNNMGADAIYLFNYMDSINIKDSETYSLLYDKKLYSRFLTIAGNESELKNEHRRHVVTFDDVYAVGASPVKALPLSCHAPESNAEVVYNAIRIPTGEIPSYKKVSVIIGLERGLETDISKLIIYANAKGCKYIGPSVCRFPAYDDMDYYAFEIPNDGKNPPVTVAEFGISEGNCRIHWIEIDVD